MGDMGAGFAQGFAQTLNTLGPVIQRNQQERESLELQKKLATASLQKHEAETALLTQKILKDQGYRDILLNGIPGQATQQFDDMGLSLGQQPGPRERFNPGNEQHRMFLGAIDPDFLKEDLKSQVQMQRWNEMGSKMGFGDMAATPSPAPSAPAQQPMAQAPEAPQPTEAPQPAGLTLPSQQVSSMKPIMVPKPTKSLGPNGPSFSVTMEPMPVKTHQFVSEDPKTGLGQNMMLIQHPVTGDPLKMIPLGNAVTPAETKKLVDRVTGLGLKIGTDEFKQAYTDLLYVEALPDKDKRAGQILFDQKYGRGLAGQAAKMTDQMEMNQKVITEAATTTAKIKAELANKPLDGKNLDKFQTLEGIQRKASRAVEIFDPRFVGKPFIDKFKEEFAAAEKLGPKFTPGAFAGTMRKFLGNASPEEVEFGNIVAELGDDILRLRSQGSTTEQEFGRMKGFMASLSDEPRTFMPTMQRLIKESTAQMETVKKTATTSAADLPTAPPKPTKPDTNDASRKVTVPKFKFDPATNRLIPVAQ